MMTSAKSSCRPFLYIFTLNFNGLGLLLIEKNKSAHFFSELLLIFSYEFTERKPFIHFSIFYWVGSSIRTITLDHPIMVKRI